eukprot:jgi/Bigna1/80706/fgenesh1_pg.73_\
MEYLRHAEWSKRRSPPLLNEGNKASVCRQCLSEISVGSKRNIGACTAEWCPLLGLKSRPPGTLPLSPSIAGLRDVYMTELNSRRGSLALPLLSRKLSTPRFLLPLLLLAMPSSSIKSDLSTCRIGKTDSPPRRALTYFDADVADECRNVASKALCSECEPGFGTGERTGVCQSICDKWFAACADTMFTTSSVSSEYIPCAFNSMLCWRLGDVVSSGREFCEKQGMKIVDDPTYSHLYCIDVTLI